MPLRKYLPASQRDHDFGTRLVKSFTALLVDFSAPRQSQLAIDCRNHKLGGPDGPLEFEEGFRRDKGADVTRMLPAWTEDDLTEQTSLLTGMKSDKTQASHLPLVRHKFLLYGNNPTERDACKKSIHRHYPILSRGFNPQHQTSASATPESTSSDSDTSSSSNSELDAVSPNQVHLQPWTGLVFRGLRRCGFGFGFFTCLCLWTAEHHCYYDPAALTSTSTQSAFCLKN
jgi:hypothetical protein